MTLRARDQVHLSNIRIEGCRDLYSALSGRWTLTGMYGPPSVTHMPSRAVNPPLYCVGQAIPSLSNQAIVRPHPYKKTPR